MSSTLSAQQFPSKIRQKCGQQTGFINELRFCHYVELESFLTADLGGFHQIHCGKLLACDLLLVRLPFPHDFVSVAICYGLTYRLTGLNCIS